MYANSSIVFLFLIVVLIYLLHSSATIIIKMEVEHHVQVAEHLAKILENKFQVFGFKFGIEPLIGLIPWVGDFIALILSLYIVLIAHRMRLSQSVISEMYRNVIVDFVLGLVPVLGDVSDFFYKANSKNLALLLKHKSDVRDGEVIVERIGS